MKKQNRYKGPAGIYKAPGSSSGYRRINDRGVVTNVQLPEGQSDLGNLGTNLIKNPFRTGKWSWNQAAGSVRPNKPGGAGVANGGAHGPGSPIRGPIGPAPEPTQQSNMFLGPWLEGFNTSGTPWMPMVGGGFINTSTGQSWMGGAPQQQTPQADTYEQSLVDMLKGMLGSL